MIGKDKAQRRALETQMRDAYLTFITAHDNDVEKWQAAHRIFPDAAVPVLTLAVGQSLIKDIVLTLMAMTQTPAHLFASLGDGVGFHERTKSVEFRSAESEAIFLRQFPDWWTPTKDRE